MDGNHGAWSSQNTASLSKYWLNIVFHSSLNIQQYSAVEIASTLLDMWASRMLHGCHAGLYTGIIVKPGGLRLLSSQQEVQPVPTSTYSQAPLSPTPQDAGDFTSQDLEPLNTLDEPIWETIKRDLARIGANLVLVVFPFKSWDQQSAALKNWDLWGPMVGY